MKIIDARSSSLQPFPFMLGDKDRSRRLEKVVVTNNPDEAPEDDEVGYFLIEDGDRTHVILTKPRKGQYGILLRINTRGAYTRNANEGRVVLKGGKATLLTEGNFASGAAGNLGSQSDELWHVEGPAIFVVTLSGGSYKGFGHRYLIVTKSFRTVMITRDDLCRLIAVDDDPEITETINMYAELLHQRVQDAIILAEKLDEQIGTDALTRVVHYIGQQSLADLAAEFGLAVPAALTENCGVAGIEANTLIPGDNPLLHLSIGPNGGRRYGFKEISRAGIQELRSEMNSKYTANRILGMVTESGWHLAWENFLDGRLKACVIANARGVHTLWVTNGSTAHQPWFGHENGAAMTEQDFRRYFDLDEAVNSQVEESATVHIASTGEWGTSMEEALRNANKNK